jgi:hypothetical protein
VLVARGVDGLLVGWLAVAVWIGVYAAERAGMPGGSANWSSVYWIAAVVVATHFGLSYHLAYRGGRAAVRARPVALLYGPIVLAVVLVGAALYAKTVGGASSARLTTALITSVYLMTTWHYVKQAYGVARVGAAFGGATLGGRDVQVLRYGLYPLWFVGAAKVLLRGTNYGLGGYRVGYAVIPDVAFRGLQVLALTMIIPTVVVFLGITRRTHRLPPSLLVAPYVAAFLWLGLPTNPVLTILLLAAFHALQYLAIGHRAELALVHDAPGRHGALWWLNIFAGAACGGLLVSRWLPRMLDQHTAAAGSPLLFTAMFFVFLNMHHYLIDASIWRSNGELVRALGRRGAPQGVANASHPVRLGADMPASPGMPLPPVPAVALTASARS